MRKTDPKDALPRLSVEFLTSAANIGQFPDDNTPEIAFAGRSNAGKSSVLNRITGNRQTAKVSKTPGRTQLLNIFDVSSGGRLVDLPGYGYAKAGKQAQAAWQASVNEYLSYRDNLCGVILVVDIRHPGSEFDEDVISWSQQSELPLHILLNKADKLKFGARQQIVRKIQAQYSQMPNLSVDCFSATTPLGVEPLIGLLTQWLAGAQGPPGVSV